MLHRFSHHRRGDYGQHTPIALERRLGGDAGGIQMEMDAAGNQHAAADLQRRQFRLGVFPPLVIQYNPNAGGQAGVRVFLAIGDELHQTRLASNAARRISSGVLDRSGIRCPAGA